MIPALSIVETDDFGTCAKILLEEKVYSLPTIYAAGYILLDRATMILDKEKSAIVVYLFPKEKADDLRRLSRDFLDELVNYAHYFTRAAENAEATKAVLQRALFSASPSLAKEAEEKEIESLIKELEAEGKESGKKGKKKQSP